MNIKVETVVSDLSHENCYIVYNDINENALIIDPGADFLKISQAVKSLKKVVKAVLVTHCHYDHVLSVALFQKQGAKVYMSASDEDFICSELNLSPCVLNKQIDPFIVDNRLIEGNLQIFGYNVSVLFTPGHTPGGTVFFIGDNMFSGDTLFKDTFGRCDLPGGNMDDMVKSLKKLFILTKDYTVYPGHGQTTTLSCEKQSNYILKYINHGKD